MIRALFGLLTAALFIDGALAQTPLRQSTSRVVRICGVVSVSDGFTPVTTLALSTADEAEVLRDNTATLDISGATWAAITGADGCYSLTLDTTATNTVGELLVAINDDSLTLPVWREFVVVEESVYDNFYAASAVGPLTAAAVNAEADTALIDYDPPTNAEMNARTLAAASYFDPAADTVANVTTTANVTNGVTVATNSDKTGYSISGTLTTLDALDTAQDTQHGNTLAVLGTPTDFGSGTSTLAANLQDLADNGTAAFDRSTDSLQAIRDRGDAAWTGAGGGDVTSISGSSAAADNLEALLATLAANAANGAYPALGIVASGTAQAYTAGTPSVTLAASTVAGDDNFNGGTILVWGSNEGDVQSATVSDYVGSTDIATIDAAFSTAPTGTINYIVFGTAAGSGGGGGDATAANQTTILSRLGVPSDLGGGASLAANLADIEGQTDDIGIAGAGLTAADDAVMTRLGAPAGASVSADIAAVPTAAETRAEIDSNSTQLAAIVADTNELQTDNVPGLIAALNDPTAAAIVAALLSETCSAPGAGSIEEQLCTDIDAVLVDTGTTLQGEVDGIQADTENIQTRLPAALNNGVMPADVQRINDVEITGDGSATPFDVP